MPAGSNIVVGAYGSVPHEVSPVPEFAVHVWHPHLIEARALPPFLQASRMLG
eukprot:CAMPEP_0206053888 /NCGR_PEP_ID=MMETSP1466-20131121/36816_1 /ASSEMBLY_ACC=CAM_ASM_001126 /TAXON_ID=44452 /ORGANISM="Pavlova gyrans, Strain CCMP608" /LENGTH=51 /DNA_ID=CAMNT_0053429075 /DNA_START=71 /DNA_END=226 /DNA_ORIENTATION=+